MSDGFKFFLRPFHMFSHCIISCGFFIGTVLVRPFLPEKNEENSSVECTGFISSSEQTRSGNNDIATANASSLVIRNIGGLPSVFWPHMIPGLGLIVLSLTFLPLTR